MTGRRDVVASFIRWVTDGFVVLYGLWTLLCHIALRGGWSFSSLYGLSFLVPLGGGAILFLLARKRRRGQESVSEAETAGVERSDPLSRTVGLAGAAALASFFALSRNLILFWAASVLFLGYFYVRHLRPPTMRPASAPPRDRSQACVFFALVLAAAVLVLVLHRPDHDDAFFLSIPVQALETPDAPLANRRPSADAAPHSVLPTYSLHSVELASGALARLLGVRPITAAHMILPVLFAVVFLCAAARLMRRLLGADWLFGLTALFFLLLFNGDVHWSYGNFGLVRFFHGKAFLAAGMTPLLAAYGLEYMSGTGRGVWPLLFSGQIAALGLSSAGLYVGPVVAGFSLLGAWRPEKRAAARLFLGALTAAYPLAMGFSLRFGPMSDNQVFLETYRSVPPLTVALDKVLGTGVFLWFWLLALLGCWTAFREASKRRWVLGYSLAFVFFFLNPYLNEFWSRALLGVEVKWRILWALPLPVWLAVLLSALSRQAAAVLLRPGMRGLALGVVLALFGALVPARWTVSASNQTQVRLPSLKVPLEDYRLAGEAAALTESGGTILAPEAIAVWVPTITRRVRPFASREFSIVFERDRILDLRSREGVERRLVLFRYISGISRERPKEELEEILSRAVAVHNIRTVVLDVRNPWRRDIVTALRGLGFAKKTLSSRRFLAYVRREEGQSPES